MRAESNQFRARTVFNSGRILTARHTHIQEARRRLNDARLRVWNPVVLDQRTDDDPRLLVREVRIEVDGQCRLAAADAEADRILLGRLQLSHTAEGGRSSMADDLGLYRHSLVVEYFQSIYLAPSLVYDVLVRQHYPFGKLQFYAKTLSPSGR